MTYEEKEGGEGRGGEGGGEGRVKSRRGERVEVREGEEGLLTHWYT